MKLPFNHSGLAGANAAAGSCPPQAANGPRNFSRSGGSAESPASRSRQARSEIETIGRERSPRDLPGDEPRFPAGGGRHALPTAGAGPADAPDFLSSWGGRVCAVIGHRQRRPKLLLRARRGRSREIAGPALSLGAQPAGASSRPSARREAWLARECQRAPSAWRCRVIGDQVVRLGRPRRRRPKTPVTG